ncbi:MAG: iron transporter [Methanobacteriota archaeon]|nr:MAG: iron transporter [Euryarchaeota archaeon]
MATVGIIPSLIIGVREGIEAALVIGIILGYLVKIGRLALKRHVYAGTIVAFFASAGVAAVLFAATVEFQGFGEQIFEGVTMLVAVAVLTSMVLWMMKAARSIKVHVQERIEAVLKQSAVFGLTLLSFVVVFREGVETALFMFGAGALTSPFEAILGVGLGLLIAGIIGVGIVRVSWRLNLRRFFQVTGIFLVVVAAGLFANAVHELQDAFAWQFGSAAVYDLHLIFPADASNTVGYLLRGIIGYSDAPTVLEVSAYVGYWVVVLLAYLGIRTGKIAIVTVPLRRGWNALFGRKAVSSADAE